MIGPVLSSRRLVGRDAELRVLLELRRAASRGRPSIVLVDGEAGIGKTRLLAEFGAGLTGGRAPYYALGECLEDAPRPFGPFRALLARLAAVERNKLDAATPTIQRSLAALLPDAFGAKPGTEAVPLDKAELFAGVLGFIQSVATARTTILVMEDIHWADSATLELLCYIASHLGTSRVMLVATNRDDVIHSGHPLFVPLGRLNRNEIVRHVRLKPLNERDVRVLIDDALGKKYVLDAERIRSVVARGEGNPFFTEEFLKETLQRSTGAPAEALPISIRATILERVGRLQRAERQVLNHAAVLGLQFESDVLARVMELDRRAVEIALRGLQDAQLLVQSAARSQFRFRHAVTRQTIYDELLPADAHDLHVQILKSLESTVEGDEHLDDLAYHAWRASLGEAALHYSERAGDAALLVSASAQAAVYYERALEVASDDDTRIRLLGRAAEAYLQQSDFRRVIDTSLRHHAMLIAKGDYDAALMALTRAAGEAANNGRPREALAMIQKFADEHGDRLTVSHADHMYASMARIATALADIPVARSFLARVRRRDALGPFTHQVYWLAQLMCCEAEVDLRTWKEAAAALRAGNYRAPALIRAQMLHQIASSSTVFGEHAEGERAINEAVAIDREMGFITVLSFAQAVKAGIMTLQGRLAEARSSIQAALAEPDAFPVRMELALAGSPAVLALGDDELTERCLAPDVLNAISDTAVPGAHEVVQGMRASQWLARGQPEKARTLLNEAVDGELHQFAAVHVLPLAAGYIDDARLARVRDWCATHAENPDYRVMKACVALCDAITACRSGSTDAVSLSEAAADQYRGLGWPLHEARALELARRTDDALSLYRTCGSVADVRRLEMGRPAPTRRQTGRGELSPREREVAELVASGLSNRAVATRLSVTEKTVEKYLSSIYAKLQFSTRTQLAAHVAHGDGLRQYGS